MVKLRLKRCGRKQQAVYQIVAIDARSRREGRDLQKVGCYDPIKKQTYLDFSAIIPFIQKGAQPTETVYDLLYRVNVVKDFHFFKPTMNNKNNKTFLYIKTKDNEIIIIRL